jgi:hypothetical protein
MSKEMDYQSQFHIAAASLAAVADLMSEVGNVEQLRDRTVQDAAMLILDQHAKMNDAFNSVIESLSAARSIKAVGK